MAQPEQASPHAAELHRVWFVSELYYPEVTGTGYYVTGIAEGVASTFRVAVLCSQPTYAARGMKAPRNEVRRGVEIQRCTGTTLDKDRLLYRIINLVTISLSIFVSSMRRIRQGDVVIVTTNPPTLPFLTLAACRLRHARCVLMLQDVYPDVLVASGWFRDGSWPVRVFARLQRHLYRSVDRILVLGRDMERLVRSQVPHGNIVMITNWADVDEIHPTQRSDNALLARLGLTDKFVVQYSGNMGRTHGIDCLVEAAAQLHADSTVHFLFIGNGARKSWLQQTVVDRGLTNVSVIPYQPRDALVISLNACDVALVSLAPRMVGVSVPSRMYNILASGTPIIAIAEVEAEVAQVVSQESLGWVVPPNSAELVVAAVRDAQANRGRLTEMGRRARTIAEQKYPSSLIISSYRSVIGELIAPVK